MTNFSENEPVFAISVVSRMVGVHQQTLRSYERIGLVRPARSPGNTRLYSQRDVERLRRVQGLMSDLGVNLAGVEVILRMNQQIEELQGQLAEMQREMRVLGGERRDGASDGPASDEGESRDG
ncbi:MAG TPA: helix-turn-helix transcriptional regulator [Dehalococcoidia bacterium]|nr:helix-turn-helix transcriptional regulator [Dehalococcoidia bacterium]